MLDIDKKLTGSADGVRKFFLYLYVSKTKKMRINFSSAPTQHESTLINAKTVEAKEYKYLETIIDN